MAAKKSVAQLDREIAEVLSKKPPKTSAASRHELFYLSEEQQGGKHAQHIEQFNKLGDALDMLAKLPAGSITYGNAAEGPKFMIVWAAPEHTDLLYWTDGDLNAQSAIRDQTIKIRERQAKRTKGASAYFDERFKRQIADLKKRDYRWTK